VVQFLLSHDTTFEKLINKGDSYLAKKTNYTSMKAFSNILGNYEKAALVRGIKADSSCSGSSYSGSVTSILLSAFENGRIDGVIATKEGENPLKPEPIYAKSQKEILLSAGMKHTYSSHVSALSKVKKGEKIAFVGLPCHVAAASKLRDRFSIEYLIGIACGTNYDYEKFSALVKEHGIEPSEIKKYILRDMRNFVPYFLFETENRKIEILVSETIDCIHDNCKRCEEYLDYDSDISFGTLGAPRGWSIAFVRNEKGKELLDLAEEKGYVETKQVKNSRISRLYRFFPNLTKLYLAFKTDNLIGAYFMADFKKNYLKRKLNSAAF
jgi:coenzyme F420 hydrogenase subunit beta